MLQKFDVDVAGVHNGFLEVLIGLGICGFALWIVPYYCWLVSAIKALWRGVDEEINILVIPLLLATVLSMGPGGWMCIEYGLYLIMIFSKLL